MGRVVWAFENAMYIYYNQSRRARRWKSHHELVCHRRCPFTIISILHFSINHDELEGGKAITNSCVIVDTHLRSSRFYISQLITAGSKVEKPSRTRVSS